MIDLPLALSDPSHPLDRVTIDGDEARAQLGVDLLPEVLQSFKGLPVCAYVRISDDKAEDAKGVRRQVKDAIWYVLQRGASKVLIIEENDTSAWKKKRIWMTDPDGYRYHVWRVIRPGWTLMLRLLRSGELKGAGVYDIDRLAREPRDLEDAIEVSTYYRRRFEGVTGSLDLMTDGGIAMARILVTMANKQSADTARRVKRKHQEQAEEGVPVGGTRPFGWQDDKRTLKLDEANEIQEGVKKILAGLSPYAVMADWNARGIKTPKGNIWRWAPFMSMLRNPRLCGYRGRSLKEQNEDGRIFHEWEIVKLADGTEVKGQWKPAIDRAEWDLLIDKIGTRARPLENYEAGSTGAKYLLSALVRCGRCRHHPKMWGYHAKGYYQYQCGAKSQGGCGGNSRSMGKVDALVTKLVFAYHDQHTGAGTVEPEDDTAEIDQRIEEIDELLTEAYDQWKAKKLPGKRYFPMSQELTEEQESLRALKKKAAKAASDVQMLDVRHRWDAATMEEKRAFISKYLQAVIIHPIEDVWDEKKQRMVHPIRWNPSLIEPIWA